MNKIEPGAKIITTVTTPPFLAGNKGLPKGEHLTIISSQVGGISASDKDGRFWILLNGEFRLLSPLEQLAQA